MCVCIYMKHTTFSILLCVMQESNVIMSFLPLSLFYRQLCCKYLINVCDVLLPLNFRVFHLKDISDLFGADLPVEGGKSGEFAWRDGPFLAALKAGHWIVLDEASLLN